MSPMKRYANKQTKARKRPRLNAQERLKQQRAQAQHYIEALHQALKDLDFPDTLVAEIEDMPLLVRMLEQMRYIVETNITNH